MRRTTKIAAILAVTLSAGLAGIAHAQQKVMSIPKGGSWIDIIEITIKTTFGLLALAAFAQNWALRQNTAVERGLLLLSGLLLVFPSLIEAIVEWIIGRDISYTYVPGLIIGLGVLLWQSRTRAPQRPALTT